MQSERELHYKGQRILVMTTGHVFVALDGSADELYPAESVEVAKQMIDYRIEEALSGSAIQET